MGWGLNLLSLGRAASGLRRPGAGIGSVVGGAAGSASGLGGSMVGSKLASMLARRHGGSPGLPPGLAQHSSPGSAPTPTFGATPGQFSTPGMAGPAVDSGVGNFVQPREGPGSPQANQQGIQQMLQNMMMAGQFSNNPIMALLMGMMNRRNNPQDNVMY